MGWDSAKSTANRAASGGTFIKLEDDDDSMVVAFLGEPNAREIHWTGEQSVQCEGKDCPHCKKGPPQAKFTINVYVKSKTMDGKTSRLEEVRLFEQGVKWFNQLVDCKDKYGLDKWWFEIKRKGSAKSTKTRYTILVDDKMTDDEIKMLSKVELLGMDRRDGNNKDDERSGREEPRRESRREEPKQEKKAVDPDGQIDTDTCSQIITELKQHPREKVKEFQEKFGVAKVKELKMKQLKDVISWLKSLKDDDDEIDPFAD